MNLLRKVNKEMNKGTEETGEEGGDETYPLEVSNVVMTNSLKQLMILLRFNQELL